MNTTITKLLNAVRDSLSPKRKATLETENNQTCSIFEADWSYEYSEKQQCFHEDISPFIIFWNKPNDYRVLGVDSYFRHSIKQEIIQEWRNMLREQGCYISFAMAKKMYDTITHALDKHCITEQVIDNAVKENKLNNS